MVAQMLAAHRYVYEHVSPSFPTHVYPHMRDRQSIDTATGMRFVIGHNLQLILTYSSVLSRLQQVRAL